MDWVLRIIPPFPIKHQKDENDDDDDDSLEVWSNVRIEGICLISLIVAIIDVIETMIAMMIPKVGFCLMCEGFSFAQMWNCTALFLHSGMR